ncbi:MAG: 16S rRNA (guanine(527)-N(7))-methyltransferase RsmG [Clostridia bacterium]|nr:16S rRNA (guanine(527)-N(7))-methyltransferase RsmG [Clostridia bacterium]
MDYLSFREYFIRIFYKNRLETYITEEHIRKFYDLTVKMVETNKVMNITALTTMDKIIPLHYADCVKAAALIPQNATVADIGCGGGFPILPLAIVRPDLNLVGIDSTEKKIRYVQNTADELGLSVTAISGRAEDLAKQTDYRDHFDVVISRAVARLNVLDELCMPFVRVGGRFFALKGAAGQEELSEAMNGIQKLGGQLQGTDEYSLFTADDEEKRVMVRIDKISATPKEYPRAFGVIKKKPL